MTSDILPIDYSREWSFKAYVDHLKFKKFFQPNLKPTSLDINKVELIKIFETGDVSSPVEANDMIKKNITDLKKKGYFFLGPYELDTLLRNQDQIPYSWIDIGDSDAIGPKSGEIRFDGGVFDDSERNLENILSPFFSRGQWSFGYAYRYFDTHESTSYSFKSLDHRMYTACLPAENL